MSGQEQRYWSGVTKRRVSRRRALAVGTAGMAASAVALGVGCGDDDDDAAPSSSTAAPSQVKTGGTLTFSNSGETPHLDIHQYSGAALYETIGTAYSRLLRLKVGPDTPQGQSVIGGELAESWEQVDDLTYVFRLRPNVKFHNIEPVNGRPLVAEDVVYSFGRQRDLRTNADFVQDIEQIKAVDQRTIQVKVKDVNVDFLLAMAGYPTLVIAREVVEKHGDLKQAPVVGTGPWIFVEWVPKNVKKMRRNPEYFLKDANGNQLPYADGIEELNIVDPSLALAAFRTGKTMTYAVSGTGGGIQQDIDNLRREIAGLSTVEEKFTLHPPAIMARTDKSPTSDVRVRQALLIKALNRQAIIDAVRSGQGALTSGVVLPTLDWMLSEDELKKLLAHDPAGAKALLQQAGVSNWNPKHKFYSVGTDGPAYGEVVQSQLKALSIATALEPCDTNCLNLVYVSGDIELLTAPTFQGTLPTADLRIRFGTGGGRNTTKLSDPQLDSLIAAQAKERNNERRKELFIQIQRRVIELAAIVPLYSAKSVTAIRPVLKNYFLPPTRYERSGLEIMWIDR